MRRARVSQCCSVNQVRTAAVVAAANVVKPMPTAKQSVYNTFDMQLMPSCDLAVKRTTIYMLPQLLLMCVRLCDLRTAGSIVIPIHLVQTDVARRKRCMPSVRPFSQISLVDRWLPASSNQSVDKFDKRTCHDTCALDTVSVTWIPQMQQST